MAVIKDTSFEGTLAAEGFYDMSGQPPVIDTALAFHGVQSLHSYVVTGPADPEGYARWRFAAPPTSAAFRMYINIDLWEPNFSEDFFAMANPSETNYLHWRVTDAGGALSIRPTFLAGVHDLTSQAISYDTWYRLEWNLNVSATGWTCSWGIGTGSQALAPVTVNATGGNTFAASTIDYVQIGMNTWANNRVYFDAVKFTDVGSDYPLGALSSPSIEDTMLLLGVG